MSRALFIRGNAILTLWDDISEDHLWQLARRRYPTAYIENHDGLFSPYPVGIFCLGNIIRMRRRRADKYLGSDWLLQFGWDGDSRKDIAKMLFFDILAAEMFRKKNAIYIASKNQEEWNDRLTAAIIFLAERPKPIQEHTHYSNLYKLYRCKPIVFKEAPTTTEPKSTDPNGMVSKIIASQSDIDQWRECVERADIPDVSYIYLKCLLDRLSGEKVEVIKARYNPKIYLQRAIGEAEAIDAPDLLNKYPGLPRLPKISNQTVKYKTRRNIIRKIERKA